MGMCGHAAICPALTQVPVSYGTVGRLLGPGSWKCAQFFFQELSCGIISQELQLICLEVLIKSTLLVEGW